MNEDARKLSPSAQEEKRKLAIKLWQKGKTQKYIADIVCVAPQTVSVWVKRYKSQGLSSLKAQKRGPKTNTRQLSSEQEVRLQKLIADQAPEQLRMPYALWTRRAVMELVEQETGIKMPIRTVGEYLKRWGFTPQKPLKQAYEQNPKAVQHWLNETYPKIKQRAKEEAADIYWGDETGVRNNCQHERGYAPTGKTPVIQLNANRVSINMISAITNQGAVRFKVFEGTMNAVVLIDFCRRLMKTSKRKVFLILDNLRVHHANVFKHWLVTHKDSIEVFYLPSYSPELNPDEYLNCDLKCGVHSGIPARNKTTLRKKVTSHMRMLQRKPKRVRKYFNHRKIRYAA